mmetsp:Transcript_13914/g.31542  ORF Transcript_13914/g.31542 Transcript_13914/m.31542 type:complete len:464 (-) Transcript_13914:22-1413(-)
MARTPKAGRRQNAWDCPPSFRQVTATSIVFGDVAVFYALVLPMLEGICRSVHLVLFTISVVVTIGFAVWTMTVDPVDPMVKEESQASDDEDSDDDVLQCDYCKCLVGLESKHCLECNKCVANYDHHCPWLNTCIGTRNYGAFYTAIWALLLLLSLLMTGTTIILVQLSWDNLPSHSFERVDLLVIYSIVLAVNLPWGLFVLALVAFHTYLCYLNVTTFDYYTGKITARKEEKLIEKRHRDRLVKGFSQGRLPFDGDEEEGEEEEYEECTPSSTRNVLVRQVAGEFPRPSSSKSWSSARTMGQTPCTGSNLHRADFNASMENLASASDGFARATSKEDPSGSDRSCASSSSSSSSAEGDEDEEPPACDVDSLFHSMAHRDGDSNLKKELSSFVFGSGIDSVSLPATRQSLAQQASVAPPAPTWSSMPGVNRASTLLDTGVGSVGRPRGDWVVAGGARDVARSSG